MVGDGREPWAGLGIAPTSDEAVIRRAYAALVRQYRPDSHPQEFARVRERYERAMTEARVLRAQEEAEDAAIDEVGVASEPDRAHPPPPSRPEPAPRVQAPDPTELGIETFDPPAALNELASTHNERGERAAVEMLHEHLARCARSTVDARLDYEWFVLRSLLTSETPPLGLVFEGERQFRWTERPADVARLFGDAAADRIAQLVEAANVWLYLREYSPNPWERRLFGERPGPLAWIGGTTLMLGAQGAARRWRDRAEALGLPVLLSRLEEKVERAVAWRGLMLADLAVGAVFAWVLLTVAWDRPGTLPLAGLGALLVFAAGSLAGPAVRWLKRRPWVLRVSGRTAAWRSGWRRWVALLVMVLVPLLGLVGLASLGGEEGQGGALELVALADLALVMLAIVAALGWLFWTVALGLESAWMRLVFAPLVTASIADFRAMRADPKRGWGASVHGWAGRLRALPGAWRLHQREESARRAQAKAQGTQGRGRGFNYWWLLWIAAVLANAVMHLK